jgi:molybdopterin synthase sulfur carrier subunit
MMMKLNILAFGIAKDIFGGSSIELPLNENATVADMKKILESQYPKLKQLASYLVAVNSEYAEDSVAVNEKDEIAIIPPVSGG